MNKWERDRQMAKMYKERYPEGTRIEVEFMGDDPRPIASGTRGTVRVVDDMGTVHCDFDNGRCLGLISGEDRFRKLTPQEIADEKKEALIASFTAGQEFYEKETGRSLVLRYAEPKDIWVFDVYDSNRDFMHRTSETAVRLALDIVHGEIVPSAEMKKELNKVIQSCEDVKKGTDVRTNEDLLDAEVER